MNLSVGAVRTLASRNAIPHGHCYTTSAGSPTQVWQGKGASAIRKCSLCDDLPRIDRDRTDRLGQKEKSLYGPPLIDLDRLLLTSRQVGETAGSYGASKGEYAVPIRRLVAAQMEADLTALA